MARKKPKPPDPPLYPWTAETFRPMDDYRRRDLVSNEPSCFNGCVRVRRYRITVEEIPESPEVIGARLQKLWEESNNYHDWDPLKHAARTIGYELQGRPGEKRKP